MTAVTALVILILLPAFAQHNETDPVLERAQKIHDLQTILDAIPREGERAVITLGILPAVYLSAKIERYLERNKDFALEFGTFARNTAYLAKLYLSKDELEPVARLELSDEVTKFEVWLESIRKRGLVAYDAEEESPVYVGPGVDPSTEELRGNVRLLLNQSAEVPEDPVIGDELYTNVATLAVLVSLPADASPEVMEYFIRIQRYFVALFRLNFRHPPRMHFEDSDRDLVVDYLKRTFRVTLDFIEQGRYPAKGGEEAAEALNRMQEWKHASRGVSEFRIPTSEFRIPTVFAFRIPNSE